MDDTNRLSGRSQPENSLAYLRAFVVRRRFLLAGVFLVVALVVSAGVLMTPHKYSGTTKFLVRQARAEMVVTSERSSARYPAEVSEEELNSEIELLNARDVLEEVARRTLLSPEQGPISAERREAAIRQLERNLVVAAVRKTNIISVAYTSDRPEFVLDILRQLSALYLQKHLAAHRTPGAHAFFKAQAEHYKDEVRRVQEQFSDFRLRRSAVSIDSQKDLLVRRRSEMQTQVSEVNASIEEVSARIARLQEATAATDLTVLSQTRAIPNLSSIERLTTLVTEMRNRRTQLLSKFQPEDRAVKEIDREIADTAAVLETVRSEPTLEQTTTLSPVRESLAIDLSKARVQLAGLTARKSRLSHEETGLWQRTTNLEAATPEHDALDKELKAAEANYQLYEAKSEEARIAEALDEEKITNVSVAQAPTVSRFPSGPSRASLMAVGICLAGIVSIGMAFGVEYLSSDGTGAYDEAAGFDHRIDNLDAHFSRERPGYSASPVTGTSVVTADSRPIAQPAYANVESQAPPAVQDHTGGRRFKIGRVYDAMMRAAEQGEDNAPPETFRRGNRGA